MPKWVKVLAINSGEPELNPQDPYAERREMAVFDLHTWAMACRHMCLCLCIHEHEHTYAHNKCNKFKKWANKNVIKETY